MLKKCMPITLIKMKLIQLYAILAPMKLKYLFCFLKLYYHNIRSRVDLFLFSFLFAQAIAFCLRCNLNLCNTCKEEHLRQPTTSSHNISELLINKIDGNNLETLNKKCSIHATIDLKLFCTTCYQVFL